MPKKKRSRATRPSCEFDFLVFTFAPHQQKQQNNKKTNKKNPPKQKKWGGVWGGGGLFLGGGGGVVGGVCARGGWGSFGAAYSYFGPIGLNEAACLRPFVSICEWFWDMTSFPFGSFP